MKSVCNHLGEGDLTDDAERAVVDGDFSVMLDPALSSENVVNARRRLVPRVLLAVVTSPVIHAHSVHKK